jgi:hypothetical protein
MAGRPFRKGKGTAMVMNTSCEPLPSVDASTAESGSRISYQAPFEQPYLLNDLLPLRSDQNWYKYRKYSLTSPSDLR